MKAKSGHGVTEVQLSDKEVVAFSNDLQKMAGEATTAEYPAITKLLKTMLSAKIVEILSRGKTPVTDDPRYQRGAE